MDRVSDDVENLFRLANFEGLGKFVIATELLCLSMACGGFTNPGQNAPEEHANIVFEKSNHTCGFDFLMVLYNDWLWPQTSPV